MKFKMTKKLKIDILLLSLVIIIGVAFCSYSTEEIYNKAYSLANGFHVQSISVAVNLVYKLFCIILLIRYLIIFCLYLNAKKWKLSITYFIFLFVSLLMIRYLPFPKPMGLCEFEGFVAGVKENIDEQQFREWIDTTLAGIEDDDGGVMIQMSELAFLSKNGIMECDGTVDKYDSKYYEIRLIWGNALAGHYGLIITNDHQRLNYVKENRRVVEVYEDIWAWTEN